MTTETTKKKEGWNDTGLGDLPPFVHLDPKDTLEGRLLQARDIKRKEKVKIKGEWQEVEKLQIGLDVELTADLKASQGSVKKKTHKRVDFYTGAKVCVIVGGNMPTLLKDAVKKLSGAELADGEEFNSEFLAPIIGKELHLERHEDGEIKEGQWKGNPVKRFVLKYR